MKRLLVVAMVVVAGCSGGTATDDTVAASPSATEAETLFRETIAEVEAVVGDLDIADRGPASDAPTDPANVQVDALGVAMDALVRRQEAELETLERRFDRIDTQADKANRRCGDDPDCMMGSLRDYEKATAKQLTRADRVAKRHDEETDWVLNRMNQAASG